MRENLRLFFAITPPEPLARRAYKVACALQSEVGGRSVRWENIHLTLLFLGAVSDQQVVDLYRQAHAVTVRSFFLRLDRLGWFSGSRVVWAGCRDTPPALYTLHQQLSSTNSARPRFHPHVTLLRYVRQASTARVDLPGWHVSEFQLVRSILYPAGAHYKVIGRFPLGGKSSKNVHQST